MQMPLTALISALTYNSVLQQDPYHISIQPVVNIIHTEKGHQADQAVASNQNNSFTTLKKQVHTSPDKQPTYCKSCHCPRPLSVSE